MKRSIALLGIMMLTSWLAAQEFDAVSIRPSDPHNFRMGLRDLPGQASYTGVTVKRLIEQAYQIRDFQIAGGPGWIASSRYDIVAKPPAGGLTFPSDPMTATDQQRQTLRETRQAMVRSMLADCFQLKTHKEIRDLPLYVLTATKGGLKELDSINKSDPDLGPGMIRLNQGSIVGRQIDIDELVASLSSVVHAIILNQTNLNGKYDLGLKWTPDQAPIASGDAVAQQPPTVSADLPDIFVALQEQMGLRLKPSKGPVEVLVIDHVEIPREN